MRKTILTPDSTTHDDTAEAGWLDLDALATIEITSEDPDHPIERALVPGEVAGGWRAALPGEQTLRVRFDAPRSITRIAMFFEDARRTRTQELALAWSSDGETFRELLRQRWNFSPEGSTREHEDVRVQLEAVKALQLTLRADVTDAAMLASLERLRVR